MEDLLKRDPRRLGDELEVVAATIYRIGERSRQEVGGELRARGGRAVGGSDGGCRRVEYAAPPGSHIVFVSGPEENRPQLPYLSGCPSSVSS